LAKKKTTRETPAPTKPRARKKPATKPAIDVSALEPDALEPATVVTDEEIDTSHTLGVVESPKDDAPRARGGRRRGGRGARPAAPAEAPPAPPRDPSSKAQVERENNAVVIRFAPVRVPAPPVSKKPAEEPRPARIDPPPQAREILPARPPAPMREEAPAPPRDRRPEPQQRGRDALEPAAPIEPHDEEAPPGNRVFEPPTHEGRLDERDDQGGGPRRRRRRRGRGGRGRGGRNGGEESGPAGTAAGPQRGAPSRGVSYDTFSERPPEPQRTQRPPQGPAQGPRRNEEIGPDGQRPLSHSQKRRMRRRRRNDQRREPGPVEAETQALPPPPPPPPPLAEPTVLRPPALDVGGEVEDEHEMEDRLEARELLEGVEPEAEADSPAETAEPAETDEAGEGGRRGRRDRRRGRGGGGRPRRRREWGDSSEADSRVYGEDDAESSAVEIEPESAPLGLDALTTDGEGAATPAAAKKREMIVNIVPHEECRIAVLEDNKLEQIYLERASSENHVGNIYKGVVTNVEASIQAAFIDFGLGKNGFLHISDLHPRFFPGSNDERTENVGRKMPRKARPPIQRCLRRGQELLVQITKEGIGTKGPTLTTYLSVPGRFLVMMPGMRQLGVSRKIEDEDLRRKLRAQLNDLELPDDIGFIARTAAEDRTKKELQADLNYLTRLWRAVEKRIASEKAPAELYRDSDLVIRTIRDVFSTDIERIVIDDASVAERAAEFLSIFSPRARDIVQTYSDPQPIFHRYGIEAELERLHSRHVPLRIGGSLVIDQTEALVAIDVNSGKFRMEDDAETTAFRINMEAADEIPRQLRLRDLGGVIICDFIDMRFENHRREIERRLIANLKLHKERAKVLRMSQFGIIEMTRQRQRASLTRSVYQDCHHCRGSGLVKTSESVALDVMRLLQLAVTRENIRAIEIAVSPEVAYLLQNRKRTQIYEMEQQYQRSISIRPEQGYSLDQLQIHCSDHRGRLVPHP
jgi:ribonuclease E